MKTKINPASISLELDGVTHILSLDKAKEVVAALGNEIEAIEGKPQISKDLLKEYEKYKKEKERQNPYPIWPTPLPPYNPLHPPTWNPMCDPKDPSYPHIYCGQPTSTCNTQ